MANATETRLSEISADRDAKIDAALDKILPPDAAPAKAPDAGEPYGKPDATEKPETPEFSEDDITRARQTLKLDQVDDELVDKLASESPKKLIDWAKRAKQRQKEADKRFRELAEQRKNESRDDRPAKPAEPQVNFEELEEIIGGDLSEKARSAFVSFRKGILDKLSALERQQSQGQSLANYATARLESIEESSAREAMRERFPQVADDEHWELLRQDAKLQARRGGYDSVRDVLEHSARILFSDVNQQEAARRLAESRKKRENGQMTSPNSPRSPQTRTLTQDQIDKISFDAIQDGKDPRAALRAAGVRV